MIVTTRSLFRSIVGLSVLALLLLPSNGYAQIIVSGTGDGTGPFDLTFLTGGGLIAIGSGPNVQFEATMQVTTGPAVVDGGSSFSGLLTITNQGSITSIDATGVFFQGSVGNVQNDGIITGLNNGVSLGTGGEVNNTGTIIGNGTGTGSGPNSVNGVYITGATGTVTNTGNGTTTGIISGSDYGVQLDIGGTVYNRGGTITGTGLNSSKGIGVGISVGDVYNTGAITGEVGQGVTIYQGAVYNGKMVDNSSGTPTYTYSGTATITGAGDGVVITGSGGEVYNYGTIKSNGTGTGTVNGVLITGAGGYVNNDGSHGGGLISGSTDGVYLSAGGSIDNADSAKITATTGAGVYISSSAPSFDGQGNPILDSSNNPVYAPVNSFVNNNAGNITGAQQGVWIENGPGFVTNHSIIFTGPNQNGMITGAIGVQLDAGGSVTNDVGAVISGDTTGVLASGGVSVDNSGIIQGGTLAVPTVAVQFNGGTGNVLKLETGSTTIGNVVMGSGSGKVTVFSGAHIDQVPVFDLGVGQNTLTFNAYTDAVNSITTGTNGQSLVQFMPGSDVKFIDGNDYTANLFQIDSDAALRFTLPAGGGTLNGNVLNNGTLDYSAGDALYTINGNLANSGTIVLASKSGITGSMGNILTVNGDYVGNGGTIVMNVKLGDSSSPTDQLVVNGTASGTTKLKIQNAGGLGAQTTGNGIDVVKTKASSSSAFSLADPVSAGAFRYELSLIGTDWYLQSTGLRSEVSLDAVMPALASRLGLSMLATVGGRNGGFFDPIQCDGNGCPMDNCCAHGLQLWSRGFGETGNFGGGGGESNHGLGSGGPAYNYDFGGIEIGADLYHDAYDNTGFYFAAGTLQSHVMAVTGAPAGRITMDGYGFGGYWTHRSPFGWYTDLVVQGTSYQKVNSNSVDFVRFDTKGWGVTASAELGYVFAFGNGFSLIPQGQVVYQHTSLNDGTDSFGQIDFSNNEEIYGRLGGRLAKGWFNDYGHLLTVWTEANFWSQFGNNARTTFSTFEGADPVTVWAPLGGTWAQIGLGLSGRLAPHVNAFGTVDYNVVLNHSGDSLGGQVGVSIDW